MAEAVGLVLGVLGLLPPLVQVCQAIRDICAGIVVHEEGCALVVEQCDHLETAVKTAVQEAASSGANAQGLEHEIVLLINTLGEVKNDLNDVRSHGRNYFRRWRESRRAGAKLVLAREKIQSVTADFTIISTIRLRNWASKESEARRKDQEDLLRFLQGILHMLEEQRTDIRSVTRTLLPGESQHLAIQTHIERAKSEGLKAATSFLEEIKALRPSETDPSYAVFKAVVDLAMKLFVNGEAIPEGHQLPEGFFGIMQRRVNLLNVQVKDLETGSIIDDEIYLRHYDTYENLVHDLVRPRRPPRQAYVILDIHLYIREEHVHRLTRRGTLWSPVQKSGYVVNTLPTGPGGWHEVELVYQAQPFLIALVVDGDEEKAAVLDYTQEESLATAIHTKWPNRKPRICLGLDVWNQGYDLKLEESGQFHSFQPYRVGLCVNFWDGNEPKFSGKAACSDEELSHPTKRPRGRPKGSKNKLRIECSKPMQRKWGRPPKKLFEPYPPTDKSSRESKKILECPKCGNNYTIIFRQHVTTHRKLHECAKCGAIFDSQSNLNRQSRAHGDGGHQGQLDDKRATAWKNYHSSVDQGETRSVSSQLKIPPTELTVSSQQFAVLRNATAEMVNSAEDLDSPPVTSSDGPIMAFLSNASLAADLIESRASSAGICPQQSLELSEQSRALVDALDSWVQRADSGGPSPQDFYASRELKGDKDSDLRAVEDFLVYNANQSPATLVKRWDEVEAKIEELRGLLFRERYYWNSTGDEVQATERLHEQARIYDVDVVSRL